MKDKSGFLNSLLLLSLLLFSSNASGADDVDQDISRLLNKLNQNTEVATKTKLNVDYVPGMATVLHGRDLAIRGVTNVYEAISLIPGIQLSKSNEGLPTVLVRGLARNLTPGKIKLLMNGIDVNSVLGAPSWTIPIEQIERIEFIRGPGSAIYGEHALIGVVNVIIKSDESSVYFRADETNRKTTGFLVNGEADDKNLKYSLTASFEYFPGGGINSGEDILHGTELESISNAPGEINNKEESRSIIFTSEYKDYKLTYQNLRYANGEFYGTANALPTPTQDINRIFDFEVVELARQVKINKEWVSALELGYYNYQQSAENLEAFPVGFNGVFTEPVQASVNYEESKKYLNYELIYNGEGQHKLLMGIEIGRLDQGDTSITRNYDPDTFTPIPSTRFTGEANWLKEGLSRDTDSVYLQDEYQYSANMTLTGGLRFTDYKTESIESKIVPRVAAVYKFSDYRIVKGQYARSYRPPVFIELYAQNNGVINGNEKLKSETLDSYELGYIYNDNETITRTTLFYNIIDNLILFSPTTQQFENENRFEIAGIEYEYSKQITIQSKVDFNFTYLKPVNDNIPLAMDGFAQYLSNATYVYTPSQHLALSAVARYVGERERDIDGTPDHLPSYTLLDLTASWSNLFAKGFNIQLGIKNALDEEYAYMSDVVSFPAGTALRPAYPDGYTQYGRIYWGKLEYNF